MADDARVWVFNGDRNPFPSAVFSTRERAETWIRTRRLSGTLTACVVDEPVYEQRVSAGRFVPRRPEQQSPAFIANFSSAHQEHYHYTDGDTGSGPAQQE